MATIELEPKTRCSSKFDQSITRPSIRQSDVKSSRIDGDEMVTEKSLQS